MKKNNYVITGGLGFIGSTITKMLVSKKDTGKCIIVDNYTNYVNPLRWTFTDYRKLRFINIKDKKLKNNINNKIIFYRGDCADFKIMYTILEKYKPKCVFHTAAVPVAKIENPNVSEFRKGSIDTTINILDCLDLVQKKSKYKLGRFVYISSSMVYGDFLKKQAFEDDTTKPKEIYGTMKLAGEEIVKGLSRFSKIPYTIIRPSAAYGPTDMNERVTQFLLLKAINNGVLEIHGKDEKLDFTYVEDLAEGTIKAAFNKKGKNETFNITTGSGRTILSYAKILRKYFKMVKFRIVSRDKTRPKRGTLSIKKAKKLINYKPKFDLEKGTLNYVKFVKGLKNINFEGAVRFPTKKSD